MLSRAVAKPPALRDRVSPPARFLTSTGSRFETTINLPSSFIILLNQSLSNQILLNQVLLRRPGASRAGSVGAHPGAGATYRPSWHEARAAPELQDPDL